jgi:hypothetical protein
MDDVGLYLQSIDRLHYGSAKESKPLAVVAIPPMFVTVEEGSIEIVGLIDEIEIDIPIGTGVLEDPRRHPLSVHIQHEPEMGILHRIPGLQSLGITRKKKTAMMAERS